MIDVSHEAPPLPLNLTRILLLLPLLSVSGFVALMMFLLSIFDRWGLTGIQLITMADIAAPSVVLGFIVATLLCAPVLLAYPLGWLNCEKPRRFVTIMLWVVVVDGILLWLANPLGLRLILAFIATIAAVRIILDARIAQPNSRMLRAALPIIPALPVAFWVVGSIGAFHDQVAEVGFVRTLTIAKKDGAPCDGDILWLGERAMVVRCAVDRDIRVMTTREGLHLIPRD
ncbi:hypothetical protein [Brevundimonas sp.]|uniref:hypothetical protein n=1 Tax=Brevundimonas sp. TaxID=1871086 RepID=UPI002FCC8721